MRTYKLAAYPDIELNDLSLYALVHECEFMSAKELDDITYLSIGSTCTFNAKTPREWKVERTA